MNKQKPKCKAAVMLGRMSRGCKKRITEADRAMRCERLVRASAILAAMRAAARVNDNARVVPVPTREKGLK